MRERDYQEYTSARQYTDEKTQMKRYITTTEASNLLNLPVKHILKLIRCGKIPALKTPNGRVLLELELILKIASSKPDDIPNPETENLNEVILEANGTIQKIYIKSSTSMAEIPDDSVHLVITSPPYFSAKVYSKEPIKEDLGNIQDLDKWLEEIKKVWQETFRVLQPGRKAFINIMNLPIKYGKNKFKTLNLFGKTIDLCEEIGFIFKRDIIWQKTNSPRANIGSFPYPGGILINNTHEFIIELEKPGNPGSKYAHLTKEQKEQSKLDKDFWLEIKKSDIWTIKPVKSQDHRDHITPFPYEIPYRLIKAFSFIGETVLDPFLGSGTTLIAAINLKRNGIGYEINPKIATKTIQKLKSLIT